MEKKVTLKVTTDEFCVLSDILSSTKECMEYDEFCDRYTDGGRFILSLTKREYEVLSKLDLIEALL